MKKILIAQFQHETNAFCPNPGDKKAFENYRFDIGQKVVETQRGLGSEVGGFIDVLDKRDDIEIVSSFAFVANPTGPVTAEVYDAALDAIRKTILENPSPDGILLCLHGAMVAEGHPDGEGDFLEYVRELLGKDIPIVVSLDLHANITAKMAELSDAIVIYNEYPHTDTYETGVYAAELMLDIIDGKSKPAMAYRRIPYLLPLFPSEMEEIRPIYEHAKELEAQNGVHFVRFAHGFFASDIEEMGIGIICVTNGDKTLAEGLADKMAQKVTQCIPDLKREYPSLDDALDRALSCKKGPAVIADASDNPGAGALSDTTHILRRILERGITGAAIATIVDEQSVKKCIASGVGSTVELELGGWSDVRYSGGPVRVNAYVKLISDGKYVSKEAISYGETINHGISAVLEIDGNYVIISSIPRQPWDIEVFRSHGIKPEDMKILVTKSAVHYRASYGKVAEEMIAVSVNGFSVPVPDGYKYKNYKGR